MTDQELIKAAASAFGRMGGSVRSEAKKKASKIRAQKQWAKVRAEKAAK